MDEHDAATARRAHVGTASWREVDGNLRRIASQRAGLDAEELRWLARAERLAIHRELGHASMLEYVERVLGYGPRVAKERLRVARALETLPALAASLASNDLAYSAVRELSRVAKPWNEDLWIGRARGKSLREVEQCVAGHEPGDDPDDEPKPDLVARPITFELTPPTLALLRQATRHLEDEAGHPLTDDDLIAGLCASALICPGDGAVGAATSRSGAAAPFQIALTICESCDRGWQDTAGRSFDAPPSTIAQARCDAQHVGRTDARDPERAWQDIPPATRRLVLRRDRGCCAVPGCRSSRWLQLHHILAQALGGTHDPSNLVTLCGGHHRALHEGRLTITGTAPDALVFGPGTAPPSAGPRIITNDAGRPQATVDEATGRTGRLDPAEVPGAGTASAAVAREQQAVQALVGLGFRPREARAAVERARAHVGTLPPSSDALEPLVRAALRELAPPRSVTSPS